MSQIRQAFVLLFQSLAFLVKSFRLFLVWLFGLVFLNPRALVMVVFMIGVLIARQGFVTLYSDSEQTWTQFLRDLYADGAAELISIALIAFLLDWLARRRSIRERKYDLIVQLGSPDNAFAREAARHLRCRGWVMDGSLSGADLKCANLEGVDLWGGDLTFADLSGANLRNARLMGVNLNRSILTRAILAGADLEEARMVRARLGGADLRDTHLESADLRHAYLEEANLQGANLRNANLAGADLDRAKLVNADLRGADLTDVRCDTDTVLPDGTLWTPDVVLSRFTDVEHPESGQQPYKEGDMQAP